MSTFASTNTRLLLPRSHAAFFRSPKIAVPTRTRVAPSSIATSKSWLMPMESSPPASSPSRSARSRSARSRRKNGRAARGRRGGGQHHQAFEAQPGAPAERFERGEELAPRGGRTSSPRRPGPPGRGRAASGRPRPPPGQPRAELDAVDRLDEVEERRRAARLVGLQVADEVPAQARPRRGRRGRDLRLGLLDPVLAEVAHAGGEGLANGAPGWVLLTATRVTSPAGARRALRRPGDALPDGGDAIGDHFLA